MPERSDRGSRPDRRRLRQRLHQAMHPDCGWPEQLRRIRRHIVWAVFVAAIVSVPVLIFALVGLPHVIRGPLVRNVIAGGTGALQAPGAPDFPRTVELLTGAALVPGNHAEVLANGDGTFGRLWSDLRAARRSITVQIYYIGPGRVLNEAVTILAERARSGVDVFFLYDAFGAQDIPRSQLDTLRAAGVRTAEFRPLRWYALDRANHRSHVRGIVIDGAVAYTGGFGLDDKWLGGGRAVGEWRETNVRFTGPAALRLQGVFVAKWAEAIGELLGGDRLYPSGPDTMPNGNGVEGTLLYSPPLTGSTTAERLLALSIASARRQLYITNAYFIPQRDFVQLLAGAARRGVDVRILTNGPATDVRSTWLAGRSRYDALLSAGVRIWEYQPTTIHAKTLVVDGVWSAIATLNFDNRSLAYNNEVAFLARDRQLGAVLDSMFREDLRLAVEIRLETFRRRPWTDRVMEWGGSVIAGVL
jgi:cardiolipin synthase